MPQPRKHDTPAQRQAAYRARSETARQRQQRERGLPELPAIATMPGTIRWNAIFRYAETLLCNAQAEMVDYFDARSEAWQESDRGMRHQERLETVETLVETLAELD